MKTDDRKQRVCPHLPADVSATSSPRPHAVCTLHVIPWSDRNKPIEDCTAGQFYLCVACYSAFVGAFEEP